MYSYASADVHGAMGCGHKTFTLVWQCTISCSGPYPMTACPKFHVGCRLGQELFAPVEWRPEQDLVLVLLPHYCKYDYATADVVRAMGCGHKSFTLVWQCTISCSGPYPMAACPEFHVGCRLGQDLFTPVG